MKDLRDAIKRWEHEFFESHGHKPSADDIRADGAIRDMYKRYHAAKRAQSEAPGAQESQGPVTPQKNKPSRKAPKPTANDEGGAEDVATDEDVEATPHQNKVTEIFPTPQFHGRALGLFDLELSPPETPSKSRSQQQAQTPQTPSGDQQVVAETPMSKRTPDYLMRRTSLFAFHPSPSGKEPTPADSPLFKRKPTRSKSVSDLVKEATELQNLQFEGQEELMLETPLPSSPLVLQSFAEEPPATTPDTDSRDTNSSTGPAATGRVRKGPKRQTKRMTMRPVNQSDMPSMAKATENYKRLKINNNRGKRTFGRR